MHARNSQQMPHWSRYCLAMKEQCLKCQKKKGQINNNNNDNGRNHVFAHCTLPSIPAQQPTRHNRNWLLTSPSPVSPLRHPVACHWNSSLKDTALTTTHCSRPTHTHNSITNFDLQEANLFGVAVHVLFIYLSNCLWVSVLFSFMFEVNIHTFYFIYIFIKMYFLWTNN